MAMSTVSGEGVSTWRAPRIVRLPTYLGGVATVWAVTALLYTFGWSRFFTNSFIDLLPLLLAIVAGHFFGYALIGGRLGSGFRDRKRLADALAAPHTLAAGYKYVFVLWAALAVLELGVGGVPPFIRALMGQPSGYLQFGLTSVHGLLLALACCLGLVEQAVRMSQAKQPIGPYTIIVVSWLVLVIGRKHIVVMLVQLVLLLLARQTVRANLASILKWGTAFVAAVLAFGFLGDFRSATGQSIKDKLAFTGPDAMPDAFVWVYSYVTTPLANLQSAYQQGFGGDGFFPVNALAGLVPQVFDVPSSISQLQEGEGYIIYPWLITSSFNVSTGFIVPLLDSGLVGIFLFSVTIGLVAATLMGLRLKMWSALAYLVAYQATIMMIFANNFANLNNVSQIPILLIFGSFMVAEESSGQGTTRLPVGRRGRNPASVH